MTIRVDWIYLNVVGLFMTGKTVSQSMMRTLSPCLTSPVGRFLLISACSCLNVFFRPFFAALASFRPSFTAAFLAFFSSGVSPLRRMLLRQSSPNSDPPKSPPSSSYSPPLSDPSSSSSPSPIAARFAAVRPFPPRPLPRRDWT